MFLHVYHNAGEDIIPIGYSLHLIINNLKLLTMNYFAAGQICSNFLPGTTNSCTSSLALRLSEDHSIFLLTTMLTFRTHYGHPSTFTLNKSACLVLVWLDVYACWVCTVNYIPATQVNLFLIAQRRLYETVCSRMSFALQIFQGGKCTYSYFSVYEY